jgi:hypothetical protein
MCLIFWDMSLRWGFRYRFLTPWLVARQPSSINNRTSVLRIPWLVAHQPSSINNNRTSILRQAQDDNPNGFKELTLTQQSQ